MSDESTVEYTINSHNTAVLHDGTLVIALGDPVKYMEHDRSSRGWTRILDTVSGVSCLGLISGVAGAIFTIIGALVAGGASPHFHAYAVGAGVCIILATLSVATTIVADRIKAYLDRKTHELATMVFPLERSLWGESEGKDSAIWSALAEKVTAKVRDRLQKMVTDGHKDAAEEVLHKMLTSCKKSWTAKGKLQKKVVTALTMSATR